MNKKKNRILILGGSGFLGSHVVDELIQKKYYVTIFDLKKNYWINIKAKFVKGNITNYKLLENEIKKHDVVYNFAGVSDLDEALQNPIKSIEFNILANSKILSFCVKYKIKRYVYSSSIYAKSTEGGFYRCSKLAAEQYIIEFNKSKKLAYTILRYGSLYGPRAGLNNGLRKIIGKAIKSKKLIYYGNKLALRKYIHVLDAAKASVKILSNAYKNKTVNLTGKYSYKIKDVFMFLAKNLKIKSNFIFKNKKNNGHYVKNPKNFKIDHGKIYNLEKPINFYEELLQMIKEKKNGL